EICERSDITFIGPSPESIRLMGDKAMARQTMMSVNVPTVPGSKGAIEDPEEAFEVARSIGFPVIIKAAAGGGGKGMRVANTEEQFLQLFQMAQNEARNAFGDPSVYLEKYLVKPRHNDVQPIGDRHAHRAHPGHREAPQRPR